jgi:hypothetical protein
MSSRKTRDFHCEVVNETVKICLRNKPTAGLKSEHTLFVMCDQVECQHVEANKPPCPLTLSLFAEEIRAREENARLRREDWQYR